MPDLIIHIGAHKTGSTAIQKYFFTNRALLAQKGVLYPQAGLHNNRHAKLRRALSRVQKDPSRTPDLQKFISELKREIDESGCDSVILSDEDFYCQRHSFANLLISSLKSSFQRIKIILYVRPQLQMWSSFYAQECKSMRVLPRHRLWGGGRDSYPGGNFIRNGMYFSSILHSYSMLIGFDNVIARLYDRSSFPGSNVVFDFLGLLDLDPALLPSADVNDSNPSWGWKSIEFSKYLAHCYSDRLGQEPSLQPSIYKALRVAIFRANHLNKSDWFGKPPNYLDDEEQQKLFFHYEHDTLMLKDRYLPDLNLAQWSDVLPRTAFSLHDIQPDEFNLALNIFSKSLPQSLRQELF
jgi:hypothetical protein